jgi:hypothetical protein
MSALTPFTSAVALDSTPSQTVELLPDPLLPVLARPLSIVGDHTYAAIWPYVRRRGAPRPIGRELIFVRDDGHLVIGSAEDSAPPELLLPLPARPPLPEDRLWSGAGLQRYLDGSRPDPADVFRRLVAVLNQFVDFTGSLAEPALMAEFFATYILTTWFSPAFSILGLLWITGDHGAGKSRLLSLLARLAHLGLFLPVPPPPAALRALAGLGASLAVDDANFLGHQSPAFNWSSPSRHSLLLAGRQRGALVTVTQVGPGVAHGARHTRQLDVSGPRIFAAVHQPQPAIAGYFLVVPLVRTAAVALAAADPADPAAWPAGMSPRDLVDDLWALALSRLRDLPPHLPLAAQAAAAPAPQLPFTPAVAATPLLGASLQPWHALLAVASWLSASGPGTAVPGLLNRLLGLAQAYHAHRPAFETSDFTILILRALFECVSAQYSALASAALATFADDDNDDNDDNDDDVVTLKVVPRRLLQKVVPRLGQADGVADSKPS